MLGFDGVDEGNILDPALGIDEGSTDGISLARP